MRSAEPPGFGWRRPSSEMLSADSVAHRNGVSAALWGGGGASSISLITPQDDLKKAGRTLSTSKREQRRAWLAQELSLPMVPFIHPGSLFE